MKFVLLILLVESCIFFSSCSRSDSIYFSFYNISKKNIDIDYSFNNNKYSLHLNPGINHTREFKENFNSVHIYFSKQNRFKGIIKEIIINDKIVVPVFSSFSSFNIDQKHFCYNFIIDDDSIYQFQFYPITYYDVRSSFRNSSIETINYLMIDFVKNNKNYKKYSNGHYWKNCIKLQKIGLRD